MSFATDGYVLLERALDPALLARVDAAAARLIDALTPEEVAARRSTGSLISLWKDAAFAELIMNPALRDAVAALRPDRRPPRYSNGYVVSKPPRSPRTFWHEDWWGWDDPASYTGFVHQVGALFYTCDTAVENGCLRVLPGSHRRRTAGHFPASDERYLELRRAEDLDAPELGDVEGERDVPMRAGDLVLLDVRLLHAAHANTSTQRRTGVLCWFIPDYEGWSPELRSRLPNVRVPESWRDRDAIAERLPPAEGSETSAPVPYGLAPGPQLR